MTIRSTNVRPFPANAHQPTLRQKLIVACLYGGLAFLMKDAFSNDLGLTLFLVLGVIYRVYIHRDKAMVSFFIRYHYLQALFLFLVLYLGFLLTLVFFTCLGAAATFVGTQALSDLLGGHVPIFLRMGYFCLVILAGVSQGGLALAGKTPKLPFITENMRYWL